MVVMTGSRSPRVLFGLLMAVAVAASACGGSDNPTVPAASPVRLPSSPISLPSFTPSQFRDLLAGLRGKPVVVNVWASWCGPCVLEAPLLATAAQTYRGKVQFVGIDIQDQLGPARAFIRRFGWSYPSVFDPTGSVRDSLGVIGQPNTVFYDSSGARVYVSSGPLTGNVLRTELRRLAPA